MVAGRFSWSVLGVDNLVRNARSEEKPVKIPIFENEIIRPFDWLGLTGSFWELHIDTIIFTWIAMAITFTLVLASRFYFRRRIVNPFSFAVEQVIEFFADLATESFGGFQYEYFTFITSLFLFTFFCNSAGMLPFVKEPTEDINTALACGVGSFLYIQYKKIELRGFKTYFLDFFKPIAVLFPINVVGELAKAISMSFRLFGNILGGSIIILIAIKSTEPYRIHFMIYTAIVLPLVMLIPKIIDLNNYPWLQKLVTINNLLIFSSAWLLIFFGLFEGVVQAFVITMLTTTYLSLISGNNDDPQQVVTQQVAAQESRA